MRTQFCLSTFLVMSVCVASARAEVVDNTFGVGGDVVVRRNNATENDGFLRIKNTSGDAEDNGTDRVGLIKYDLSGLTETITSALVRFELPRGASTGQAANTFNAGESLSLYGVPDLGSDEDFDEATVTFETFPYLTGVGSVTEPRPETDLTGNGVNDDLATLLATFTFDVQPDAGDLVSFQSPELVAFLQADTNDIATFILASSQTVDVGDTAVFVSDTGTEGTPLPPQLRTNTDVVNADFNGGGIDITDFHVLRSNYLTGTLQTEGDANFDGAVNHEDFFIWRTAFGAAGGNLSAITWSVPEPSTCALLAVSCLTLSARRSRRRASLRR